MQTLNSHKKLENFSIIWDYQFRYKREFVLLKGITTFSSLHLYFKERKEDNVIGHFLIILYTHLTSATLLSISL